MYSISSIILKIIMLSIIFMLVVTTAEILSLFRVFVNNTVIDPIVHLRTPLADFILFS